MENLVSIEQQINELKDGDHLCLIYERDPLEQMPSLIPFIKYGLSNNEQFIYIADDTPVDQLSTLLKINGIDVENESSRGALKLWSRIEWRQPGELDSEKKLQQVKGFIDDAFNLGFSGIRFAVEMTWTLGPEISVEKLEHWEATINNIFTPGFPGKIICQYSRHRLPASVINQAFKTHPMAIIDNCVCRNSFYEAPLILKDKSESARTDWMMTEIKNNSVQHKLNHKQEKIDYKSLSWGSHFCHFYKTKEDLVEVLVPYYKAGLENNEMCIWVTSAPLNSVAAEKELRKVVPDLSSYFNKGQIEIIDADNWYLENGKLLPLSDVLDKWIIKEKEGIKKGFSGLRLSGNTYWLEQGDKAKFDEYECKVHDSIHNHKMIALCSYCLDKCSPSDIVNIVSSHQSTFIKKNGVLKRIETNEHKRAESILSDAYKELEKRVNERTAELLRSLNEKDILLKEIHHRVKNNLQMVSSLLKMQSINLDDDDKAAKIFQECQNRIKSMALVHQALYNTNDFSTLNLQDYIANLSRDLLKSYNLNPDKVKLEINVKDSLLDIDTSMTCGLIINELLMNSIKHAFPGNMAGKISVDFTIKDNRAKLIIGDNGIGLPKDFDPYNSSTLGMKLILTLTDQLEGDIRISNGKGMTFDIEFPVTNNLKAEHEAKNNINC